MTLQERVRLLEQAMQMIDEVVFELPDGEDQEVQSMLVNASYDIQESINLMEQINE